MNDDTPMCERHKANSIQSEGYQNQDSHDSYSHQSHHDPNGPEKSLKKLNNDVRNDLEDFKRCICSMRTAHDKNFDRDDQSKTDFKKSITKFLDGQRVSKQTDRTEPPPSPRAHTEHVNAVFTRSGKSNDPSKTQKDPPPPIIVEDKPIKTSKKRLTMYLLLIQDEKSARKHKRVSRVYVGRFSVSYAALTLVEVMAELRVHIKRSVASLLLVCSLGCANGGYCFFASAAQLACIVYQSESDKKFKAVL
ncbi:hypothetical protein Tco_0524667 [Tanacetum coccineum]